MTNVTGGVSTPHQRLYIRTILQQLDMDTQRVTLFHRRYWNAAGIPEAPLGTDLDGYLRALTKAQASALVRALEKDGPTDQIQLIRNLGGILMPKLIVPLLDTPVKVLSDGSRCEVGDTCTDHVAVLIPSVDLLIHVHSLGDAAGKALPNWQACADRCRDLRVLGADDWQLAPLAVWERYVFDRSRFNPAVDPNLYPGILPRWHWTDTDCAWEKKSVAGSSASAWGVLADGGDVDNGPRYGYGFALAVRRAGQ